MAQPSLQNCFNSVTSKGFRHKWPDLMCMFFKVMAKQNAIRFKSRV